MADRTGIEWTDATWNPIRGCSRVSQGCLHCYAEAVAARFSKPGQAYHGLVDKNGRWNGRINAVPQHMSDPIRWRRPRKIFVNSMSDLFHENVEDHVIDEIFAVMALANRHTFQILTKRPARMREYLKARACAAYNSVRFEHSPVWPAPNVWLGVSAEDQATWDERVALLGETPAAVRFVSAEPLLGPIDAGNAFDCPADDDPFGRIDWVIVGGESGPGARPMNITWARSLVQQCQHAGVAVFVKQLGARPYLTESSDIVTHTAAGSRIRVQAASVELLLELRDQKGGDWDEWPDYLEDLRVREFPVVPA